MPVIRLYADNGHMLSYEFEVLIHRRPTQLTQPRQLAHIHHPRHKRRIMLIENRRNAILCRFRSSNVFAFGFCVLHAASDAVADHAELQLCEDAAHLDEGLAHGVDCAFAAVYGDAAHNDQAQVFLLYCVQDFAQLLGAAAQAADFERDDGVAGVCGFQEHAQVLFDFRVAVFVFENDFVSSCGFEFADSAVDVLAVFAGTAARVSEFLRASF